ncbi:MAG: glycerol-3-phosphate responsive antiterminator [Eubacteriales bacterium]|nr:glycerol-3-phosphate responsive antiterminator [Eubacteriales bacterium]
MSAMDLLEISPVIAAVKDDRGLKRCLDSECQTVFILYGNICNIQRIVETLKEHGKYAMVHADLVQGLGSREVAMDFLKEYTKADGIISTKPMLVRRAMEVGLFGILRAFMIDSMAVDNTKKMLESFSPDMMEIMPGVMPKIIRTLRECTDIPLISGGLISEKKEVLEMFSAGADAISTTKEELWFI